MSLQQWLLELSARVRVADVLDVAVVSVALYVAIVWVRRARSRFALAGLGALVALYFAARLLDMVLTLLIFQAGITIALVALIVIFQEDIRRAFERLAMEGRLRRRIARTAHAELVEPLLESVADLAHRRIGALIVLRGHEPLERHLSGGFTLQGRPSVPLFASIFDPGSVGHDGAVIVDHGVVEKFGVRLPLSSNVPEGATYGTRHTAALGLSERSDALILVVSEERGTIGVAQGGDLARGVPPDELRARIVAFLEDVWPERRVSLARRIFAKDLGTKAAAVAIATLAWAVVIGRESEVVVRTYAVPIAVRDVPADWLLEEPEPIEARVTLSGRARDFAGLDVDHLTFNLAADRLRPGEHKVALRERDLGLPAGLSVHRIEPEQVSIVVHETQVVELPVKPVTRGRLRAGLRLGKLVPAPARVPVRVRRDERHRHVDVRTEPVELGALLATTTLPRMLVLPRGTRAAETTPREVMVTAEIVGTPK